MRKGDGRSRNHHTRPTFRRSAHCATTSLLRAPPEAPCAALLAQRLTAGPTGSGRLLGAVFHLLVGLAAQYESVRAHYGRSEHPSRGGPRGSHGAARRAVAEAEPGTGAAPAFGGRAGLGPRAARRMLRGPRSALTG